MLNIFYYCVSVFDLSFIQDIQKKEGSRTDHGKHGTDRSGKEANHEHPFDDPAMNERYRRLLHEHVSHRNIFFLQIHLWHQCDNGIKSRVIYFLNILIQFNICSPKEGI